MKGVGVFMDPVQNNDDLSDSQKSILFNKATEAPFTGELLNEHNEGQFSCANCGAALFDSDAKFNSGTGWPSFDKALTGAVNLVEDDSHGMIRTEAVCAKCGGHLGHLFDDGPTDTTGERYCINSGSMCFLPKDS